MTSATECAICGGGSSVEETRLAPQGRVRRRRKCVQCGVTWRTYETRDDRETLLDRAERDVDAVLAGARSILDYLACVLPD